MIVTQETMVLRTETGDVPLGVVLGDIAKHLAKVAHTYFVERHVRSGDWNDLKSRISRESGLTHR